MSLLHEGYGQQCLMWVLTFYYMHKATKRPGAPESNLRCRSDRGAVWGARTGWFSGIFKLVHWGLGQLLFDTHSHMHVAFINPALVAVFLVLFNILALSSAPPCKQSYCIIRFIHDAHLFLYNWYKYCICTIFILQTHLKRIEKHALSCQVFVQEVSDIDFCLNVVKSCTLEKASMVPR